MLYFINTVTKEESIECGRRSPSGDREFRARRLPVGDGLPHSEVQFRPESVIVFMKPTAKTRKRSEAHTLSSLRFPGTGLKNVDVAIGVRQVEGTFTIANFPG